MAFAPANRVTLPERMTHDQRVSKVFRMHRQGHSDQDIADTTGLVLLEVQDLRARWDHQFYLKEKYSDPSKSSFDSASLTILILIFCGILLAVYHDDLSAWISKYREKATTPLAFTTPSN